MPILCKDSTTKPQSELIWQLVEISTRLMEMALEVFLEIQFKFYQSKLPLFPGVEPGIR
jgi:hypothetical protein